MKGWGACGPTQDRLLVSASNFTCKASLSARTPSLIWFLLRLQNVRERKMRGGSTNLFTLCKVYLVSVPHSVPGSQASDRFNSFTATQLHIDIPISGLISIFMKCGMCRVFAQQLHIYMYIHIYIYQKNCTVQLTSVGLTHTRPNLKL